MPPPGAPCEWPASFFGSSAIIASVVISRPATEAASCSAQRTTLVGSMTPSAYEIAVLVCLRIVAEAVLGVLEDLADDDRAILTRVGEDLAGRRLQSLAHDLNADLLVFIVGLQGFESLAGTQQRHAAARNDAFFNGCAGCVQRVVDAVLAFLDFDFRRAADLDDGNAASKLRQTLLQLLTVVVRGRFLDLRLDLLHAGFDVGLLAGAVDDRGVFLVDRHLLGAAEHLRASRSRA